MRTQSGNYNRLPKETQAPGPVAQAETKHRLPDQHTPTLQAATTPDGIGGTLHNGENTVPPFTYTSPDRCWTPGSCLPKCQGDRGFQRQYTALRGNQLNMTGRPESVGHSPSELDSPNMLFPT
ncbi:Hypothetical predicted protein [Pelobates cultripes]|uniref:Uncharacterized protein n=1 Tax=Pelobates cultripes TaxID=61616 RepID=A0AAD1RHY1_PELCU|nr:Hypothetical predicted protein [Pelobates cultripes]